MSFYRREFSKEKKWVPFRYSGVGRVLEWRIVESRVTDVTWKTRPDSSIGTPKDVLRLTSGRLGPRYGPPRGPKVTKASFRSSEICSGDLLLWAFGQQSQWSGTLLIHQALIDRPRAPRDPATIYDQSEVLSWSLLVPNTPSKIPSFHSLVKTSIWVVSDHRPSWPLLDTCLYMVDGWQFGSLFDSKPQTLNHTMNSSLQPRSHNHSCTTFYPEFGWQSTNKIHMVVKFTRDCAVLYND